MEGPAREAITKRREAERRAEEMRRQLSEVAAREERLPELRHPHRRHVERGDAGPTSWRGGDQQPKPHNNLKIAHPPPGAKARKNNSRANTAARELEGVIKALFFPTLT